MDERIFEEIRTWARQNNGKVGAFIKVGETGTEWPLNAAVLTMLNEDGGSYGDDISFIFREIK